MINKIKDMVEKGVIDDSVLAEIKNIEEKNIILKNEVSKLESINQELKEGRDKAKKINNIFKSKLNIEDGEELSEELIVNKFKSSTDYSKSKNEIAAMELELKKMKEKYEEDLKNNNKILFGKDIELELLKKGTKIKAISNVALDLIMSNLKKGAELIDGSIVYKNESGEVLRKDGIPISIDDRINELKESEDYSCFFLTDAQSGSGISSKSSSDTSVIRSLSPAAQTMAKRALALGIKI